MILISGEALVDLIPDRAKENAYDAVLGGSPYNVAIGLGRLGAPTAFVSRISQDPNGQSLMAALTAEGVDLSHIAVDARPTPLAFVMRGTAQTGSRYSFYLDATAYDAKWPFPPTWPKGATHLHVGSIAAVEARHSAAVVDALQMARSFSTTSYDPNIRPMVTPDRASVLAQVERQASLATIVKASDEDLEWLYPGRDPEESIAHWASLGPLFALVTRGSKGAVAFLKGERIAAPAPKVDVVDTVGAGDSFMSGMLAAMHADGALGAGATAPNSASLARWLRFAANASAITCGRKGSDPPTRAEVEARLATGDSTGAFK